MAGGSADIGIRVFLDDAASQGLYAINSSLGSIGRSVTTASRAMGDLSAAMAGLGIAVGFIAALLLFGVALKSAVDAASQFQQAMFSVAVATHVPLDAAMQYASVLMNLAATSTYTSSEIAAGIVQMGRAGYSIRDIFNGMAQAGIALGIATRSTAEQGFTLLTQAMRAYNAPASEAMHYADLLQFAFEHQRGSVSDLTSAFSQVLPEASRFHVGLRDVVAALDTFGPAMASSSRAGTSLRYMLDGLYSPTEGAQKEMVSLGLASVDAAGHFHSAFYNSRGEPIDFAAAVQILHDKLKGMNQEAQNDALHKLFSVRGGQGASDLLQMINQFSTYLKQLQQSSDNAGGAMRRWNEVMGTLGGALAGLRSSITDLGVVIGTALLPFLTQLATRANQVVTAVRQSAMGNPEAAASFLKLGAAMSAVGLVATIVVLAVAGIGTGILAFVGIVLGVVAGVVLLTVGIMMLVNRFQQLYASSAQVRALVSAVGNTFNDLANSVRSSVVQALQLVQAMFTQTGLKMSDVENTAKFLGAVLLILGVILMGVVVGGIRGVVFALSMLIAGLALVVGGVIQFISGVTQLFVGFFNVIMGLVTGNTARIQQGFAQMGQGILAMFMGLVNALVGILVAGFGSIIGLVVGFAQGVISWFQNLANALVGHSIVPDMMASILASVTSVLSAILGFIGGFVSSVISFFINMGAQVVAAAVFAWNMFRTVVTIAIAAAVVLVSSGAANMVSQVVSFGARVVAVAISAWNGFSNAVSSGIHTAVGFVQSGIANIISVISSLPGQLFSWGARAMQSFASGLQSAIGAVTSAVANAAGIIGNFLAHASPAKFGPLSHDDEWMPNMMSMFASGIERSGPILQNALARATGGMASVPQMSRLGVPSIGTGTAAAGGGSKIVQLVVDGRILGQAVMDDLTSQLQLNGTGRAFR